LVTLANTNKHAYSAIVSLVVKKMQIISNPENCTCRVGKLYNVCCVVICWQTVLVHRSGWCVSTCLHVTPRFNWMG